VTREAVAATLGIGVLTPDLSTLAAPAVPLPPVDSGQKPAPLRSLDVGKARRIELAPPDKGSGFAAALAKAIAARKAANDRQASRAETRPARVEVGERENAVRDVVRQLKQLVGAVREALSPKRTNNRAEVPTYAGEGPQGRGPAPGSARALGGGAEADAAALNGVFARLVGMNPDANDSGKGAEGLSLSPQQAEDVTKLLQTVADALAQATSSDGEIDEASLASALAADPLALAAAQALVSAAQAQQLIAVPVVLPATAELAQGDAVTVGEQSANNATAVAGDAPALSTESTGTTPLSSSELPADAAVAADASFAEAVKLAARAASADGASETGADVSTATSASQPGVPADAATIAAAVEAVLSVTDTADTASSVDASPTSAGAASAVTDEAAASLQAANDSVAPVTVQEAPVAAMADVSASGAAPQGNTATLEMSEAVAAPTSPAQRTLDGAAAGAPTPYSDQSAGAAATQPAALEAGSAAGASTAAITGVTDSVSTAAVQPAPTQAVAAERPASSGGDLTGSSGDGSAGSANPGSGATATRTSASAGSASSVASATGGDASPASPAIQASSTVQTTAAAGPETTATAPTTSPVGIAPAATAPAISAEVVSPVPVDGSAASVDLHEQVAPVIVREARLVSVGGNHELTMSLHPDNLGPLHVRIELVEGALSVGLTTATSDAQRALETALPQLRGALVDSGLRLDRLDVSLRDSGGGSQRGGSGNLGRGNDDRPGSGSGNGYASRQFEGRSDGGPSFADVLFDQDGRVFGPASRGARALGYRAYGRGRSR